jgi:hypothetical protein
VNIPNPPGLELFRDSLDVKVGIDQQGEIGIQFLQWPFKLPAFKYLQEEGWVLLELGQFGEVKIQLPVFKTDDGNFVAEMGIGLLREGETAILENGQTYRAKGLRIPVKYFLQHLNLTFLQDHLPDSVPLTPDISLENMISSMGGKPENLPADFRDYLDIELPQTFKFEVVVTPWGEVDYNLQFPEIGDILKAPKIPLPAGPILLGLKIRRLALNQVMGFITLDLDMEADVFFLPLLVSLSLFDVHTLPLLPDFREIHCKFICRNLSLVLSTGFPLPLFFDELGFSYLGIEGIAARTAWKFPKPQLSLQDLPNFIAFISQLKRFFSERDYMLQEADLGDADLRFSIESTYVKLPEYVGGSMIGSEGEIARIEASDIIVHLLNNLKKPNLNGLFRLIPREIRFLSGEIAFGPIAASLSLGITTPEEFTRDNPGGLPANILDTLFAGQEKGILVLMSGGWQVEPLINLDMLFGMSLKDFSGAGLHFAFIGEVGRGFIGLEISGKTVFDFENKSAPFLIDGRCKLKLLGREIAALEVRLDDESFAFSGKVDLIDLPLLKAGGELDGYLKKDGSFSLHGTAQVSLADIALSAGSAALTNNSIEVTADFLGSELLLGIRIDDGKFTAKGGVHYNFDLPKVRLGPFKLKGPAGVEMNLGSFTLDASFSGEIDMLLAGTTFEGKIDGGFNFMGQDWDLPRITIKVVPRSLDELAKAIVDFIKDHAKEIFASLFTDVDKWLDAIGQKIIEGVEKVGEILTGIYQLSADEAMEMLTDKKISISQTIHIDIDSPHVNVNYPHVNTPQIHANVNPVHASAGGHSNHTGPHVSSHVNFP